jgi:hypothetical protein
LRRRYVGDFEFVRRAEMRAKDRFHAASLAHQAGSQSWRVACGGLLTPLPLRPVCP